MKQKKIKIITNKECNVNVRKIIIPTLWPNSILYKVQDILSEWYSFSALGCHMRATLFFIIFLFSFFFFFSFTVAVCRRSDLLFGFIWRGWAVCCRPLAPSRCICSASTLPRPAPSSDHRPPRQNWFRGSSPEWWESCSQSWRWSHWPGRWMPDGTNSERLVI